MDFHKAALLHIKFGKCGFGYWRLGNASQLFLWWLTVTWRMPWLPKTAYMEGWNAAWRQFHQGGRPVGDTVVPEHDVTLYFECGCRVSYFPLSNGRIMGGLACCAKHEAPRQQLENILPLTVARVVRHE